MPSVMRVALLAFLAAIYFAAGRFGLSLAFVNQSATAVWPPAGIAIAACLLAGSWVWPAVLVGAFLVNLTTTSALLPSLMIACGNTAGVLVAASLVRSFADGAAAFEKTTRILIYVAATAAAAALAATIGLMTLVLGGLASGSDLAMTWLTWWTGDLSGALLVTPAIVTWARMRLHPWPWERLVEVLLLLVALSAAGYGVFGPTPAGFAVIP